MKHIELFAGCGGLSLGLKPLGFELLFANELSPMASETFSYNFFNENLKQLASENKEAVNTLWLNSKFKKNELTQRLRENPKEPLKLGESHNDLLVDGAQIKESIVVGSITDLNKFLTNNKKILNQIKNSFGQGKVDLISGGPPCQSFSMAGLREHDNERNSLPWEFAKFVGLIGPKMVMLENVSGILRAFDVNGEKHFAWYEIAKAFALKGYVPLCFHVNAKYSGTAQNRPRFIMMAFRKSLFYKFRKHVNSNKNSIEMKVINNSYKFYKFVQENDARKIPYEKLEIKDRLECHDLVKWPDKYNDTFFSPLLQNRNKDTWNSVEDAIDDLRNGNAGDCSGYVGMINELFEQPSYLEQSVKPLNQALRANGLRVRKRFRLYQILSKVKPEVSKEITNYLRDTSYHIDVEAIKKIRTYKLLNDKNKLTNLVKRNALLDERKDLENYLAELVTKKHTQKALIRKDPAPATLSIPDDACHYHASQHRTLTVREMARIQSFPDWFKFRSKVTTGGDKRKFEVPQYTQVGNAVPPLFGFALGKMVKEILNVTNN